MEHRATVGGSTEAKAPKVDPEVVRQVFFGMNGLRFMPVTDAELMEKPNTVIVAGNGVFVHKRLPLSDMTFKVVETDHFKGILPKVASTVDVHVPMLPWVTLLQVIAFFRETYDRLKSEAYCQVLYCPSEDRWQVYVPEQEVTGGSVEHLGIRGDRMIDGVTWLHVWDIHSHGNMAPFYSSTDDADEGRAHRFYGVIGKLDEAMPKMKIRISDGQGKFLEPPMHALIELPEVQVVEVNALSMLTETPEVTLPLDQVDVPMEWTMAVNPPKPVANVYTSFDGWDEHGGYAGRQAYDGVGGNGPISRGYNGYSAAGYQVNDNRRFGRDFGSPAMRRMWGLNPEDPKDTDKK